MKFLTFTLLSALAALSSAQDITTDDGSMPTNMAAAPTVAGPTPTDPNLSSAEAMASCITGSAYMSCNAPLTTNLAPCTTGGAKAMASCACSRASRAVSCAEMCSVSLDQSLISMVSGTCKSVVGIGIPTTGANAQSGAAAAARPTGMAVAAMAGMIGALL